MFKLNKTLNNVRDRVFSNIHGNNLIYNTCWEDPRCDREMMQIQPDSQIVMITSAGCNALDYLLDNPAGIHCIDVNPRQNALLALKIAGFRQLSSQDFYEFFGNGKHPQAVEKYQNQLRQALPEYAQQIWDNKIKAFSGKGLRKSFYFYGTSGLFAWFFYNYMRTRPKLHRQIFELLEAPSIETQHQLYYALESKLINYFLRWVINRHLTMSMLGVPRPQRQLIIDKYPDEKVAGFVKDCLRQVFTQLSLKDNYFWRLYITGHYTPNCCPNYLLADNFETLKARSGQIHQYTTTMSQFLKDHPAQYSHYVLLDHQDWLAAHDVAALEEEWRLILQNSRPGTKILLRSAALEVDFFPEFVKEALQFDQVQTAKLHKQDRVGTYGSVYFATVK